MHAQSGSTRDLLEDASDRSIEYLQELETREVPPTGDALDGLTALDGPMPDRPSSPTEVLRLLDEIGSPATMATAGSRYFGFVVGAAMPVTVAVSWLARAWDQNALMSLLSPTGTACERISIGWIVDLLDFPSGAWGALVSGATEANFTGLAAARDALLWREGWDLATKGIFGAPEVRAVVSEEAHVSVLKSLRMLGFGKDRLLWVPTDQQGRMRADKLPELNSRTVICLQAGNVNSGAFDPADEICHLAKDAGAWVHVDGSFGLWAAVSPDRNHLTRGLSEADSWALGAHKWLNVPYDCGIVLCRHPEDLSGSMSLDGAGYVGERTDLEPHDLTLAVSRRARGVELWAALKSLGREGIINLINRTCDHASHFASSLSEAGYEILNDVVINQVLVSFGDDDKTERVLSEVQTEGTCWMNGTTWHGKSAMRISVSSWSTTSEDVERCVATILKIADDVE